MPMKDPRRGAPAKGADPNQRNEYIPSFISKKPFYVAESERDAAGGDDYLEHQRLQSTTPSTLANQKWYDRGRKSGPAATKYRKGACENCGSMTHKANECLSRPRKIGARWTGKDIEADETVQKVELGWDAKRDRWNGYDAREYSKVIDEYNELEELKKKLKREKGQNAGATDEDKAGDDSGIEEGDRYEEETDMGRKQATSTRNLRIREDTAKYLLNLDLDSARYDPKSRSLLDTGATADNVSALVAEEGFMKASGDAGEFERAQMYAWETQQRGDPDKIHLQANPTSGALTRRKEQAEAVAKQAADKKALMEKYGPQEGFRRDLAKDAAVVENARFVEYDERGRIKGAPVVKAKSSYPEDVLINNHTTVWGSWWKDFRWAYACCHSTVKNSYCTGEAGKEALEQQVNNLADAEGEEEEAPKQIAWQDEEQDAIEPASDEAGVDAENKVGRKRKLEQLRDGGVEDPEMEEYRKKRIAPNDPMAAHLGKDELVA